MTGLESYRVQTIYVTAVNVLTGGFIWNKPGLGRVYSSCPINTFAATDMLTRPSLKLFTTPGTFKHVLCIYDYM